MNFKLLLLLVESVLFSTVISQKLRNETKLEAVYQWKYVDFVFDSQARKENVIYDKSDIAIVNFYLIEGNYIL